MKKKNIRMNSILTLLSKIYVRIPFDIGIYSKFKIELINLSLLLIAFLGNTNERVERDGLIMTENYGKV